MGAGRPTKYNPDFCDKVKEFGKNGASLREMALDLNVAYSTFDLWRHQHQEFSDAVAEAVEFAQGWWEKNGRLGTFGDTMPVNSTMFKFNMINRFRKDWNETSKQEITGANGEPLHKTVYVTKEDQNEADSHIDSILNGDANDS